MPLNRILLTLAFVPLFVLSYPQPALMNNEGALVYTAPNSIVKIKGSFDNDVNGLFQNWGTTTIDSTFYNNGKSEKSGFYRVGKDWVNNNIFICDSSQVFLFGNNQFITGDSVSRYWILELQGTGIKTQQIRSYTKNTLKLNDRELATDVYFMHVLNTDTASITRSTGFVSSLGVGRLIREMDKTEAYLFPTGSSLNTTRYRPVRLRTETNALHTLGARLANNDATLDGYNRANVDSFVCRTNPFFYHFVTRNAGTDNVDVRIFYDLQDDSLWDGMAHWELPTTAGRWNDLSPVTLYPSVSGLSSVSKIAWQDLNTEQFILTRIRPGVPDILGLDTVCGNKTQLYTGVPENDTWVYNWDVNNGSVVSQPSVNEASILWNAAGGPGSITLTVTAPNGCTSFSFNNPTFVYPEVIAAFNFNPNGAYGSKPIAFADQSTNAVQWNWDFGDGIEGTIQNPTHIYNAAGDYEVVLIATSPQGCTDTTSASINITDGINIPNVFTPNDDGKNDIFEVSLSGFQNYHCYIYNRWGTLMFESEAAQISWDGTTAAGVLVPTGTYFCIIEYTTTEGPQKYTGTVNVHY